LAAYVFVDNRLQLSSYCYVKVLMLKLRHMMTWPFLVWLMTFSAFNHCVYIRIF